MKKFTSVACITLLFGTILFGLIYPLCIWTIAHLFFPSSSEGSPVLYKKTIIGLEHIGQRFSSPYYFWSRPGVGTHDISGGSHLSWSSEILRQKVRDRVNFVRQLHPGSFVIPHDFVMESASGFDPHISLKAALFQIKRVATARNISEEELQSFTVKHMCSHYFGFFPDHINVLQLNQALDQCFPQTKGSSENITDQLMSIR